MKKNKSSAAMLLAKRKDKKTNLIQSCNTKYGTLRQYVSAHTQFAVLCADRLGGNTVWLLEQSRASSWLFGFMNVNVFRHDKLRCLYQVMINIMCLLIYLYIYINNSELSGNTL